MKTVIITGMAGCGMRKIGERLVADDGMFGPDYQIYIRDVGDMMYDIDILGHPPPPPTREEWEEKILDRPRSALAALRKAVFEKITTERTAMEERELEEGVTYVLLVFVHATFFWRHDIQIGTPFESVEELQPDFFVTVVDDLRRVARKLYRQERWHDLSLEEILWWRAVETSTTAAVARALRVPHYVLGRDEDLRTVVNLIIHHPSAMKRVYASYPISHVSEEELRQSEEFVEELREHFIVFNPLSIGDVEYGRDQLFQDYCKDLAVHINEADVNELRALPGVGPKLAQRMLDYRAANGPFQTLYDIAKVPGISKHLIERWGPGAYIDKAVRKFERSQLERVRKQLDHQTVSRDYDFIDQSDYIMVHYTKTVLEKQLQELMGRKEIMPLSPGVICEMQHAHTHHKSVYAVWQSERDPSPFFDFYCTHSEKTKEDLLIFLCNEGIIG